MIAWIRFVLTAALVIPGLIVCCIGVYGMFRFDYAANRMHAAALIDTMGIALCVVGLSISAPDIFSALKLLQTENGLWRTILDDEESYEEVSASAGIAAAMVIKGNPLHLKYIDKAVEGILANVTPEGRVRNVSAGTAVMRDREGYLGIPRKWTQGWGQGLALAFLAAVLEAGSRTVDGAL